MTLRTILIATSSLALIACIASPPTTENVRADFHKQNGEGYRVKEIKIVEPEVTSHIFEIIYQKPDDSVLYSQKWQYTTTDDKKWEFTYKSNEKLFENKTQ